MTVIDHFWAVYCQQCQKRWLFDDYDEMDRFFLEHRDNNGHRVQTGTAKQRADRAPGITHTQAIANVANVMGIASIVSDERP